MNTSFSAVDAIRSTINKMVVAAGLRPSREEFTQQLQIEEARIGSLLFGDVPAGHHREFYQQDAVTWVWNEMVPQNGSYQTFKTEYKVTRQGVYKIQDGKTIGVLRGNELANFTAAVKEYAVRVKGHLATI